MNATNNGYLGFDSVRIPREQMLMKNAQVLEVRNAVIRKHPVFQTLCVLDIPRQQTVSSMLLIQIISLCHRPLEKLQICSGVE
jgi:hypothetical protein